MAVRRAGLGYAAGLVLGLSSACSRDTEPEGGPPPEGPVKSGEAVVDASPRREPKRETAPKPHKPEEEPAAEQPEEVDDELVFYAVEPPRASDPPTRIEVVVPHTGKSLRAEDDPGEVMTFAFTDPRVPATIRALRLHLISVAPPRALTDPKSLVLIPTMYDGDFWHVGYDVPKVDGPMLAIGRAPRPEARLRAVEPLRRRPADDVWLELLEEDPLGVANVTKPDTMQVIDGRFRYGAQKLVVGNWSFEDEDIGVMGTARADRSDGVTQDLQLVGPNSSHGHVEVNAVGDVDGDGFDDILWTSTGIEDGAVLLTFTSEFGVEHRSLMAWGH